MVAIKPTERVLGLDEQIARTLEVIAPKDIKERSDLDEEEILNLSVIYIWGEMLNINTLKKFADNFCRLRNSRFRLGRREIVAIASMSQEPERKKFRSLRDLFSGMR